MTKFIRHDGHVFEYCALESVVIPSTLEVLEEDTFHGCEKLSSVVFAEGSRLKEIRKECFARTNLKTFEAFPSLRKIGNMAFYRCERLRYVVLNEGLEAVGEENEKSNDNGAFEFSGIKEIVLPSTLVQLGKDTFKDCCFLKRVWVEQYCQICIADYVEPKVDVQVFQAGDGDPLESILSSAANVE